MNNPKLYYSLKDEGYKEHMLKAIDALQNPNATEEWADKCEARITASPSFSQKERAELRTRWLIHTRAIAMFNEI